MFFLLLIIYSQQPIKADLLCILIASYSRLQKTNLTNKKIGSFALTYNLYI